MADLPPDLGYELLNPPKVAGSGFRFGRGTQVHVTSSDVSTPDIRSDDQPNPRADGIIFGRDYLGGLTINFDINIKTSSTAIPSAKDTHRAMATAWHTEDTGVGASRITPGEVSELLLRDGSQTLVAYGRPRNYHATRGRTRMGWIPVTASFQTITHKFYEYEWQTNGITTAPDTSTGFEFPLIFPLRTVGTQSMEDWVEVGGNTETWMLTRVDGPIAAPVIEVVGYYSIETSSDFSLGPHEYLEIDPRPWQRKVLKNGVQNVAGKFKQSSRRLSMQTLPPGMHKIILKGSDQTGTARLTTSWRNAWTTW
jgi:hypothetical protein